VQQPDKALILVEAIHFCSDLFDLEPLHAEAAPGIFRVVAMRDDFLRKGWRLRVVQPGNSG
jgi:hypothetical protein